MTTGTGEQQKQRAVRWSVQWPVLIWALAAAVTVVAACVLPLLQNPRHYFVGDTSAAYYGWWFHLGDQVRAGHWPLLDVASWRAGNFVAEGQWGLFSPLTIGIGLLASSMSHVLLFATAVKFALAVTGALGVFALARSYRVPAPAAYVAAVAVPLGGMTQYLDLTSWAAGLTIWALLPWVWWALRRTMLGASPFPALFLGYLLVTVGYVYGTIMLIVVLLACLLDSRITRDRAAALRVIGVGAVCGLVAVAVYLPGVLTAPVTIRDSEFGGFGGKFNTDLLSMFTSILPTSAVAGVTTTLVPYAFTAWFLPVLFWLDLDRLRRAWRPLAGLFFVTGVTFLIVVGPSRFGPLRWPLRMAPFLVQALVLVSAVLLTRFVVRRPSPLRLAASLLWVLLAAVVMVLRSPSIWTAQVTAGVIIGLGLTALWAMLRADRRRLRSMAVVAAAFTLVLFAVQRVDFPQRASPERNLPAHLADYRTQVPAAAGDVMLLGDPVPVLERHPRSSQALLAGSAWYLNEHPVQNTYTTISFRSYYDRYCMTFVGATCRGALRTLFSEEPTTGRLRVDLLSVSTLLLVRADFTGTELRTPPPGWHVAGRTRWTVTWVRDRPVPTAGGPVWSTKGLTVSQRSSTNRTLRLDVGTVPPGGGRVVLSRMDWPGYSTDAGRLVAATDDYLVTLEVPASAAGTTVTVHFSPPAWKLELACWWAGVLLALGWSLGQLVRRLRPRRDGPRPLI